MQTELATIIPVADQGGKRTVNARQLHGFLEVKKDFSDWIKLRIKKLGFVDGEDFVAVSRSPIRGSGNRGASIDYHLSIDMAKELSLLEKNAKGKLARVYFINCEKALRVIVASPVVAVPTSLSAALRLAADKADEAEALKLVVKEQAAIVEQQAPAVEFMGKYVEATGQFGVTASAKMLNVAPKRFFQLCDDKGVLFRDGMGDWVPYQQWIEAGYCTLKTGMAHEKHAFKQARFTSKGLVWVRSRLGLNDPPEELGLMNKAG